MASTIGYPADSNTTYTTVIPRVFGDNGYRTGVVPEDVFQVLCSQQWGIIQGIDCHEKKDFRTGESFRMMFIRWLLFKPPADVLSALENGGHVEIPIDNYGHFWKLRKFEPREKKQNTPINKFCPVFRKHGYCQECVDDPKTPIDPVYGHCWKVVEEPTQEQEKKQQQQQQQVMFSDIHIHESSVRNVDKDGYVKDVKFSFTPIPKQTTKTATATSKTQKTVSFKQDKEEFPMLSKTQPKQTLQGHWNPDNEFYREMDTFMENGLTQDEMRMAQQEQDRFDEMLMENRIGYMTEM